jgi:predicted acylesterase/phospholipase RssA
MENNDDDNGNDNEDVHKEVVNHHMHGQHTHIPKKTHIKHIVMSGGGICGFAFYGALRESEKAGFWNIDDIESIYGTSIGSFIAVLISLKKQFDWETLDDFLIKRPWNELFKLNVETMFNALTKNGILEKSVIVSTFEPLFNAVDIDINITMLDFYKYTGIDLHIIVSKITNFLVPSKCEFILENMNHITHGHWKVIDAVYCSACLPIMFQPFLYDNAYYIDGGLLCNYPLSLCEANEDEIFGLCCDNDDKTIEIEGVVDYILLLLTAMWHKITMKASPIKNQICMKTPTINFKDIIETTQIREIRMARINEGGEQWRGFYKKLCEEDAEKMVGNGCVGGDVSQEV